MPEPTNRPSGGRLAASQLNFHQLFIFQMVANHLSFSRAAEALEITQPAVSIQVQELEKFLPRQGFRGLPGVFSCAAPGRGPRAKFTSIIYDGSPCRTDLT